MWPAAPPPRSTCSPADALFASALLYQHCSVPISSAPARSSRPSRRPLRAFGSAGCAGWVAQEFGDHPDTAAARMRWARSVAAGASSVLPAAA